MSFPSNHNDADMARLENRVEPLIYKKREVSPQLALAKLHQSATEDVARGQDLGAVIDVLYI